ncbi:MAG: gliding motility-associated C-terminal domain-containing protein [Elusimicrobiales bacterium]|nr:gliding motility-associated C-terminal domain-containing protein [Elusimicrobiales bacterium]
MKTVPAIFLAAAAFLAPAAVLSSPSGLGQSVAMTRMITPNGDGYNDSFIFRCYNPRDAAIEAKIFDLSGREVAKMRLKQRSNGTPPVTDNASGAYYDLEWSPNASGHSPGGVYIYQVAVETKVYKGTITVIR